MGPPLELCVCCNTLSYARENKLITFEFLFMRSECVNQVPPIEKQRVNFFALDEFTQTQSDAYTSRFVAVRVAGIFDGEYMLSILSA